MLKHLRDLKKRVGSIKKLFIRAFTGLSDFVKAHKTTTVTPSIERILMVSKVSIRKKGFGITAF